MKDNKPEKIYDQKRIISCSWECPQENGKAQAPKTSGGHLPSKAKGGSKQLNKQNGNT